MIAATIALVLVSIAGAAVGRLGARRAQAGHRQALEVSTLKYQLEHDPDHVIARAAVAYAITLSGARLAWAGCAISAVALVGLIILALI